MEHTSLAQEELLASCDATSFMQAFDCLLLQFAPREGLVATPELSHQILRHADEVGLQPEAWIKTCIPLLESLQKKNLIDEAQVIAEQLEARLLSGGIISSLLVEALSRLSYLATIRRDFDHARELLNQARFHMTSSKDVDMSAFGLYLFSCGQLDIRSRKLDSAISNFETAATVYGLLGQEDNVALTTAHKARAQMLAGYPALARRFYSSAIDSSASFKRQWITIAINYSICLLWLGELARGAGVWGG